MLVGSPAAKGHFWIFIATPCCCSQSGLSPAEFAFPGVRRARAGLKDVRIHDLRHTFASTAVAVGQGLPMIGKLLGHTEVQTTARYAHLAVDPFQTAADAVSRQLATMLQQ
jgi:integrase